MCVSCLNAQKLAGIQSVTLACTEDGQPFGALAATAAQPTPPPPSPTTTTTTTSRGQADVTSASPCCQ